MKSPRKKTQSRYWKVQIQTQKHEETRDWKV